MTKKWFHTSSDEILRMGPQKYMDGIRDGGLVVRRIHRDSS